MSIGIEDELKDQRANKVPFLTHLGEPTDTYSEYLSEGPQPADESRNPRNLFDDSNRIDRKWLKSARTYLRGLSKFH